MKNKNANFPYEAFGQRLVKARALKGILQADLAKILTVKQQTISRWENGTFRPTTKAVGKLIQYFEVKEVDEWYEAAGYKIAPSSNNDTSFASRLPLAQLHHENFERFTSQLLSYLRPNGKVHRLGGPGDSQDGTDIEVRYSDGIYDDFQCKRHKTFGPQKVHDVVSDYHRSGKEKIIVLSRPATAEARKAVAKYSDWDIWDAEDISQKVRFELSEEQACRLIRIFFPGQQLALLGISEPNPWQTSEEFFLPFNQRESVFNHTWKLVGRANELKEIFQHLENDTTSLTFISAAGGSGKSKLLYELSSLFQNTHPEVTFRIVSNTEKVTSKSIDELGNKEKVLVVEDAHELENLNLLFQIAANPASRVKLLFLTRPYGLEKLRSNANKYLTAPNAIFISNISPLTEQEATLLAHEILSSLSGPVELAKTIAKLTYECPLATTIGSYLVATQRIHPELLANESRFKEQLLSRFRDVITGELGSPAYAKQLQSLLQLVALLQPFNPEDANFKHLAEQELEKPYNEIQKSLTLLIKSGVIIKRNNRYRFSLDSLADFIVEEACLGLNEKSTGYAERIFDKSSADQLEKLLINIGKVDWRLTYADKSTGYILDNIWQKIDAAEITEELIKAITSIAIYQPEKAFEFARKLIKQNEYLSEIPKLLKNIAYHIEFFIPACEYLWKLGKNDTHPTNQFPNHAVRILTEICGVELNKPIDYCEKAVEFGLALANNEAEWGAKHTPFDVLQPILETEVRVVESKGLDIGFSFYQVLHKAVAPLRTKVIDAAIRLLSCKDNKVAITAAKFLHHALRYPMHNRLEEIRDTWTSDFLVTLGKIKEAVITNNLDYLVLIEILKSIEWHESFDSPTQKITKEIISLLPTSIEFRTMRALIDGWGHHWRRDLDLRLRGEAWREELQHIADELIKTYLTPNELLNLIDSQLTKIYSLSVYTNASPHALIQTLLNKSIDFATELTVTASKNPKIQIAEYSGLALSVIIPHDRHQGIIYATQFLATQETVLHIAVAQAYGSLDKMLCNFLQEEIEIIRRLCSNKNANVLAIAIHILAKLGYFNRQLAIEILLEIDFNNSHKLTDEVLSIFYDKNTFPLATLETDYYKKIFQKLAMLEELNGHWIEEFLANASFYQPMLTTAFLIARTDHAVENDSWQFRPFNYGPYLHVPLKFRGTDKFHSLLSLVYDWMLTKDRNYMFKKHNAELFLVMFGQLDEVIINFFEKRIEQGTQADVEIIADIISSAPSTFVITNHEFVIKFIQLAEQYGSACLDYVEGCLSRSAITGSKSGIFGEPFPEDVILRDGAKNVVINLQRSHCAYQFYNNLLKYAENEIKRTKNDRASFDD